MQEGKRQPERPCSETGSGEMSEAEIDKTVADTFPASDPPSWTLGTDHRDGCPDETSIEESELDESPQRP
ncbi:MAG TPA: hypothetical protein VIG62_08780 [Blastocatellia bacterium]